MQSRSINWLRVIFQLYAGYLRSLYRTSSSLNSETKGARTHPEASWCVRLREGLGFTVWGAEVSPIVLKVGSARRHDTLKVFLAASWLTLESLVEP